MTASLTIEALRVTQGAGLSFHPLLEPGMAMVKCPRCGWSAEVVMSRWIALPAAERGCVPKSVGRCPSC